MSEPRTPEEAAAEAAWRARERAGEYVGAAELDAPGAQERPLERLHDWAVVEVDPAVVRSTRRGGAPITALKRALLRLLRQYHVEHDARIARFNLHLLEEVAALERRVAELQTRVEELERGRG